MSTKIVPVEVLIADDHPVFRKGLKQAIEEQPGSWHVQEAVDGEEVIACCKTQRLDALILDVNMPKLDGLATMRRLRQENLPMRAMLLTMQDDDELINAGMELGVLAFVLKDDDIADCLRALHLVLEDKHYLSPSLFNRFVQTRQRIEVLKPVKPDPAQFTAAERRILELIADDLTSKEIASRLHCSVHTVNAHRQNLSTKLGLSGTHSLLKFAYDYRQQMTPPGAASGI
jgi:DNA-binding NarL/FixJ family response regulator